MFTGQLSMHFFTGETILYAIKLTTTMRHKDGMVKMGGILMSCICILEYICLCEENRNVSKKVPLTRLTYNE